MPSPCPFRDQHILITGASAGIGEAFARRLAERGAHLILSARRKDRLDALAGELSTRHGIQAHVVVQDLAVPGGGRLLYDLVKTQGLEVDILINNAGIGLFGPFSQGPLERYEEIIRVNLEALTALTHRCLPHMLEGGRGGILNIGSTGSFQPVPWLSVYGGTKAYVLSFSEGLASELRGTGVQVTVLCPGTTDTEFHDIADTKGILPRFLHESADQVAVRGLHVFEQGVIVKVSGMLNQLIAQGPRFFPRVAVANGIGDVMVRGKARADRKRRRKGGKG